MLRLESIPVTIIDFLMSACSGIEIDMLLSFATGIEREKLTELNVVTL
jgi:hypothetical protein